MAIQAPAHTERLILLNDIHAIDPAVTAHTTDACGQVHAVIEVRIVWKQVNTDPFDGRIVLRAGPDLLDLIATGFDVCMAVHTGCCRWDRRPRTTFDRVVTIAAVHAQLTGMNLVTERNGLLRTVTDIREVRR